MPHRLMGGEVAQLVPCETCGNAVADSAQICPHCGDVGPAEKAAQRRSTITCLAWLVFVVIIALIIVFS
jgi:predicted nucleic acid-binding Zn ribbon protein